MDTRFRIASSGHGTYRVIILNGDGCEDIIHRTFLDIDAARAWCEGIINAVQSPFGIEIEDRETNGEGRREWKR